MFPFSDKAYQYMKWGATIAIPAVATLTGTVGTALGWDATGVVVTIVAGVGTFIGMLVGASTVQYNKSINTQEETVAEGTD